MSTSPSEDSVESIEDLLDDFGKAFVRAWKDREAEAAPAIQAGDIVDVFEPRSGKFMLRGKVSQIAEGMVKLTKPLMALDGDHANVQTPVVIAAKNCRPAFNTRPLPSLEDWQVKNQA